MTATQPQLSKIVTFRLGDDLFAADVFSVERVLRYTDPTPLPNVPDWLAGVIEYQGRVVPVVDLRRRFELPPRTRSGETRILIFTAADDYVGAVVDGVLEVTTVDPEKIAPPPPLFRGLAAEYLQGVLRMRERLIVLLDMRRLLSAEERMRLQAMTEDASGREGADD